MSKARLLLHRAVGALLCSALVGALIVGTLCPPGEEVQASGLDISLQGLTATVVGDVCNLRAGPGTGHRVVGRVVRGERLEVRDIRSHWVAVRGGEAWIAGWLVEIDLTPRNAVAVVERTAVNLRAGPGLDHRVVGRTDRGACFPALALRGEWVKVRRGEGTAWVWLPLVSLQAGPAGMAPPASAPPGTVPSDMPAPGGPPAGAARVREGFPPGMLVYPAEGNATVHRTAVPGSERVGRLTAGSPAAYLDTRQGWIRVRMADGTVGWVWGPEARPEWPHDRSVYCRVGPDRWEMGRYGTATVTARNVNFRAGPGLKYRVLTRLNRGDVLRVVGRSGDWIHAVTRGGTAGWVAGWLTGGVKRPRDDFRVSVEAAEDRRVLTLTGDFGSASVSPGEGGTSLVVRTSRPLPARAALGVGAFEFSYIAVAGHEVTVFLQEQPRYQVLENGPGRLVLEFRAEISSMSLGARESGEVLAIHTAGYVWPHASRGAEGVEVFLPGALYTPDTGPLPADGAPHASRLLTGLTVRPGAGGLNLTLAVAPGVSYRVEKEPNLVRIHLLPPGLRGKTIVVDPGHGGGDTGARGPTGLLEKDVNWEIARCLAELLESRGARVILTRRGDASAVAPPGWTPDRDDYEGELAWRAGWSWGADLYVSIHNDYHPSRSARGTTTYVAPDTLNGAESRRLAWLIQEEVVGAVGTVSRGVQDGEYYVIRKAACPAVLVELMYVSNPREESLLRQDATRWLAARALLRALDRYCGAPAPEAPPQPQGPPAPRP
ncbi:MAG: N-acetylmuramoyl-L-alanine amidase [Bacillota bacterium]|nr:N-acetylmuramoyl-L-alanine amidase [Bacillota bacterium]MDI7249764.1 N-acetylmuramoyl-L-alanine amidase [Bacillota bacterium]